MPELSQRERLQPSLLDRLTDDAPANSQESREDRVMSLARLREYVVRDLAWLLNTDNFESSRQDLDDFPHVARSSLNYGIPTLSGLTTTGFKIPEIEQRIRQAIWDFEPRIIRESVIVRASVSDSHMSRNSVRFEIEGELWAQPLPLHLFLHTEVDLETGNVSVTY